MLKAGVGWEGLSDPEELAAVIEFVRGAPLGSAKASAVDCLRAVLRRTDINTFSVPPHADKGIHHFMIAAHDAYVGETAASFWDRLKSSWPGSEVTSVHAGHVSGVVFGLEQHTNAIIDLLEKTRTAMEMGGEIG